MKQFAAREESVLIKTAQAGSPDAFAALVVMHRQKIIRLAYRLTNDKQEAEDIAQEAFCRAYAALNTFVPDRPFYVWLFTIARNTSMTELRKRTSASRVVQKYIDGGACEPQEPAVVEETGAELRRALSTLPEVYQVVLKLHYFRDLPYREIAERLSIPLGTVKTRISRAKRILRIEYENHVSRRPPALG